MTTRPLAPDAPPPPQPPGTADRLPRPRAVPRTTNAARPNSQPVWAGEERGRGGQSPPHPPTGQTKTSARPPQSTHVTTRSRRHDVSNSRDGQMTTITTIQTTGQSSQPVCGGGGGGGRGGGGRAPPLHPHMSNKNHETRAVGPRDDKKQRRGTVNHHAGNRTNTGGPGDRNNGSGKKQNDASPR